MNSLDDYKTFLPSSPVPAAPQPRIVPGTKVAESPRQPIRAPCPACLHAPHSRTTEEHPLPGVGTTAEPLAACPVPLAGPPGKSSPTAVGTAMVPGRLGGKGRCSGICWPPT